MHSYKSFKQKGLNTNFLTWTALRSSIINMKSKSSCSIPKAGNLNPMNFDYKSKSFNAYTAKCKQFYSMMISSKERIPNGFKKWRADFELSNAQEVFSIPYLVASKMYVWSFQYRVLNFILFTCTNDKLFKIGLSDSDKCSFCGTYTEDLYHLFFNCSFVQAFWNVFTIWCFDLSGEYLSLSLKDIMVGLLQRNDLLHYLIILGKLTIWECRKNDTSLIFDCFCTRLKLKNKLKK